MNKVQNTFKEDVSSLIETISSSGYPFMEEGDELPSAIQIYIASPSVVKTINDIDVKGKSHYEESI